MKILFVENKIETSQNLTLSRMPMDKSMMESGKMGSAGGVEFFICQMALSIRGSGSRIKQMTMEEWFTLMEMFTRVAGRMARHMVLHSSFFFLRGGDDYPNLINLISIIGAVEHGLLLKFCDL